MLGRMIPASTVQEHLQNILNAHTGDAPLTATEIAAVEAGGDMGLLTIDSRDAKGTPNAITWTRL